MTRFVVFAALVLGSTLWVACDVGTVLANSSTDGGGSGSGSGSGSDCPAASATPAAAHTHAVGGTSNAGMACIAAGCHLDGTGGAPIFNYAGTIYNAAGTGPAPGINVLITLGGTTKKWMTDADGNFYVPDPLQAAPTATMQATTKVCQTPTAMVGALGAGNGNCSSAQSCHGGTEGKITSQP
ncbi:MAG: hypothetical protein ABI591_08370 [Kofleriaceae bacterium]